MGVGLEIKKGFLKGYHVLVEVSKKAKNIKSKKISR